jgi:UDP-N-acetylmuramate--alanine ligase
VADPLDLSVPRRIHLIAIGGAAMAPMAELLVAMGHTVSGSHLEDSPRLDRLRSIGVAVSVGHDASLVAGADLVASSSAVADDHVERRAALDRQIPVVGRPVLQGAIVRTRRPIAVSGTHGKTTTTALLVTILVRNGLDPSYLVGSVMGGDYGACRWGAGEWFVVEADESDGTFLELGAEIAIVTNIDADHLDRWGSVEALEAGFDRFLSGATVHGIVCSDDPAAERVGARHGAISVGGGPESDWRIDDIVVGRGSTTFGLTHDDTTTSVRLPLAGAHNARNAAVAIAAAHAVGVDPDSAAAALEAFPGIDRRFELRGEVGGVTVVDDYAHNPAKVASVLSAAASGGWGRVLAVFQPHRYSRTADLWERFADCFVDADVVWITELDPSGESPLPGISGRLVHQAVAAAHPDVDVRWAPDRAALVAELTAELRDGDLCLTIGAGDITDLPNEVLAALAERTS